MQRNHDPGLEKVMDMTRLISVLVLLLHSYFFCYQVFARWHLRSDLSDRILHNIAETGLLDGEIKTKLIALGMLLLSLMGTQGTKTPYLKFRGPASLFLVGLFLYFSGALLVSTPPVVLLSPELRGACYMGMTLLGYLLILRGGAMVTRLFKVKLQGDIFNKDNETFPQEERLLDTEYSLNFETRYQLRGKARHGWINVVNVFRGLLICGLPGSGKTLLVKEVIRQQIKKHFSMLVYDFKYPDLTIPAYNYYLRFARTYPVAPEFYILDFAHPFYRSNPLAAEYLRDIQDASEAARTILLGLNHEWIDKQGNFWVESPISLLTAVIWYLRRTEGGLYCTLPHVIELIHTPYEALFTILQADPEVAILVRPFVTAFEQGAFHQLEGQISGATISLGKLAAPNLYYVLSGNDFTMDIGNPKKPKIVCMASSPAKANLYGSVISLYLTAFQRLATREGNLPTSLVLEEFPSLLFNGIDRFLAVCRSYLVAVTFVIQDISQLTLYYGTHHAKVIVNLLGNLISGQVTGESARMLSQRFGRIIQQRNSISVSQDPSMSVSGQLADAVPASTIASLSAGEVAGMVADSPDHILKRKMFHGKVMHDFEAISRAEARFISLPDQKADTETIMARFKGIKNEIKELVDTQMHFITTSPGLKGLVLKKKRVPGEV